MSCCCYLLPKRSCPEHDGPRPRLDLEFLRAVARAVLERSPGQLTVREIARTVAADVEDVEPALVHLLNRGELVYQKWSTRNTGGPR